MLHLLDPGETFFSEKALKKKIGVHVKRCLQKFDNKAFLCFKESSSLQVKQHLIEITLVTNMKQ